MNKFPTDKKIDYNRLYQDMPCGCWLMNRNHIYTCFNPEAFNVFEIKIAQEIIGKDIFDLGKIENWMKHQVQQIYDLDEYVMQTGKDKFDIQKKGALGGHRRPVFDNTGKVIGLMWMEIFSKTHLVRAYDENNEFLGVVGMDPNPLWFNNNSSDKFKN